MMSKQYMEINGEDLSISSIMCVAYAQANVGIAPQVKDHIERSHAIIMQTITQGNSVYGVTTNFGGMADHAVSQEYYTALQENLLWGLKCGVGKKLPIEHIRASMLIRANALVRGASGIRLELIKRLCQFLNAGVTPIVYDHGSIGASGDLVPLAYIAGALIGLSVDYKVDFAGQEIDAPTALKQLNLTPIQLQPKEGLALVNGTAMMTGIAAACVAETISLLELTLSIHGFFLQALQSSSEAFDAFVHEHKPHKGQIEVAQKIRRLLAGSKLLDNLDANEKSLRNQLLQDRYSIRCLPQYLGVIFDGVNIIKQQVEVEANSTTDNPLIDIANERVLHAGNFMGQYIGIGMDQLRYYIGLVAKHIDTQIALLVTPEFSNGLPPSLIGDSEHPIKFGLKGLQICGNSIMPLLLHLGNNIAHLFPTHAEQFNQNINSQGFASANLAWQSVELCKEYLAVALIFAIQSVDLRCFLRYQNYHTRDYLSPQLIPLYEAVYSVTEHLMTETKPFIYHNHEQSLDKYIAQITADLKCNNSKIISALSNTNNNTANTIRELDLQE